MKSFFRGPRVLFAVAALGLLAIAAVNVFVPPTDDERLQVMRAQMQAQRWEADSCQAALVRDEEALHVRDARLDSLRVQITAYEALDPRGVPAETYEAYINAFETYNNSIPERVTAADSLRAHWDACSEIARRHNELADSARGLAAALGLLDELPERVPVVTQPQGTDGTSGPSKTVP